MIKQMLLVPIIVAENNVVVGTHLTEMRAKPGLYICRYTQFKIMPI